MQIVDQILIPYLTTNFTKNLSLKDLDLIYIYIILFNRIYSPRDSVPFGHWFPWLMCCQFCLYVSWNFFVKFRISKGVIIPAILQSL